MTLNDGDGRNSKMNTLFCLREGVGGTAFCPAGAHTESNVKVEKLFVVQALRKPEVPNLILPLMALDKVNGLPRTLISHL